MTEIDINKRRKSSKDRLPSTSIDIRGARHGRTRLLVASLAISAATGGVLLSQDPSETGGTNDPDKFGDPNPYISSLTIDQDARIRADPFVAEDGGGHTNLLTTIDTPITVKIMRGVDQVFVEENGTEEWYGITTHSLPELDLNNDKDGIVWVSEQKASVEIKDQ